MASDTHGLEALQALATPAPEAAAAAEPKRDQYGRAYATGKRKNAVARVWIKPGKGKITINDRDQEIYFARPVLRMMIAQPLQVADRLGQFDVTVSVTDSSANVTEAWAVVSVSPAPASSSVGTFPGFVAGLFLSVLEGIVEVAVVVLPIAGAVLLVLLPLQKRLGSRHTRSVSEPQPASG